MLVDGAVIDNIPLRSMKALKAGPNLVVHFGERGARSALRRTMRASRAAGV
jgi:predicted acylesterase/phospholipase RssA